MKTSRSYAVLLPALVVIVFVQCKALALPVLGDDSHTQHKRTSSPPIATTTISNSHTCLISGGPCHFYSHCIESHFHCGPLGFTQAYAETRCEAINTLQRSDEPCETCIGSTALYNWATQQDQCLKTKLEHTVVNEFITMRSDPPTCLQLERRGLELMKECAHTQSDLFCSALTDSTFERDIAVITNTFRIDSYYATQVERILRDLVLSCGTGPHVSTLAQSVLSTVGIHTPRLVICTFLHPSQSDSYEMALQMLSERLERSVDQFEFSGIDYQSRCISGYEYPPFISPSSEDQLLFITWHPNNTDALINNLNTTPYRNELMGVNAVFWQYEPLRSNDAFPECGDGRRQAGELCDMGVGNIDSYDVAGCDFTCQPTLPGYVECSTRQFETSQCWDVACGDGVRSIGEECDDGNLRSGDGCSSNCREEQGYKCSRAYNRTSVCFDTSAITATTDYPPATTSPPSTLHSVSHNPPPSFPTTTLPSSPPSSLHSTSSSHHSEDTSPPAVEGISATASAAASHQRIVALHCLVSALVTLTVYWVMTR